MGAVPSSIQALVERFDASVLDEAQRNARLRLWCGEQRWDVVVADGTARIEPSKRVRADATLSADAASWTRIADDVRGGMAAFGAGRLRIRHNLHLGVGFLAATSANRGAGRLRFGRAAGGRGEISYLEAGRGRPVLLLHGLGATKASMLPTVAALADGFRPIAIDLPGFGDSDKPVGATYGPRFFAGSVVALMDSLGIDRADVIGNSMGGRVALELGLLAPERVRRLVLLCPSLAWRHEPRWAPYLRLVRPELGLLQPMSRPLAEAVVRRLVPGGRDGWVAAGVNEFLRSYVTRRGRAAFYAAARSIVLEDPKGRTGFWTRLPSLRPPALFVWGLHDTLVPLAFQRHVAETLPAASHTVLDCGHVPQLECPRETHRAVMTFLEARAIRARRPRIAA